MVKNYLYYKAINWNEIEDELDNATWERATSLFWLDTRIPIEEDKEKWENLSLAEQEQLNRNLLILANLATYQSIEASEIIRRSERSQQEIAIINNLQFTEIVNTKAYNRILRVFHDDRDLTEWFSWVDNELSLQDLVTLIDDVYYSQNPMKKRFIAICLEGIINLAFLAYPLKLWLEKEFLNLGSVLEMVIRNESLHCIYLGHKLELLMSETDQESLHQFLVWANDTLEELMKKTLNVIERYYTSEEAQKLAKVLVQQEAGHISERLGLPYEKCEEVFELDRINQKLNQLRHHDLTHHSFKSLSQVQDDMTDDDYDF